MTKIAIFSIISLFLLAIPISSSAKMFNKCSLAREMAKLGVPTSELNDWVCIAEHESSFKTNAVGKPNKNGSRDWGLLQINDKYWCQPDNGQFSYNSCKISCKSLLTDDISVTVKCARLVKKQQGFKAWVAWKNKCQGNIPSVDECF